MSRWANAANEAAAELDAIRGAFLLDLDFDSGHVRANDSHADLSFGGNTYTGIGTFGSFDGVEESVEFVARGMQFGLSGVDSGIISTIKNDVYQNRAAALYVGLFGQNSNDLVATPELVWSGYMDTMPIEIRKNIGTIRLKCEHRLRNSPPNSRWSDGEQQARSTNDRFFNNCTLVTSYTSTWGNKGTTYGPRPGGGNGFG